MSAQAKQFSILALPGDGIGPEVTTEALKVLDVVARSSGLKIDVRTEKLFGGSSIDAIGKPISEELVEAAKQADAVLMGAVGGPKWAGKTPTPESGILTLRLALNTFANLRPCRLPSASLAHLSPLKPHLVTGTDFMLVRENCGGAYFGDKLEGEEEAMDPWYYSRSEIERVGRVAGALARARHSSSSSHSSSAASKGKFENEPAPRVISCDKANVLASSRLWRRVMTSLFEREFPDVTLEHELADSAAMRMVLSPRKYNGVLVMDNTFGDILSDVSAVVPGSLGLLPSASLDGVPGEDGGRKVRGLYEPVHGSAPDIAGRGIANPVAAILSVAMMLRYSFGLDREADVVEGAVQKVLDARDAGGLELRTADLGGSVSTTQMGDAVAEQVAEMLKSS